MFTAFQQYLATLKLSPVSRKLYLADVRKFLVNLGVNPTLSQLTAGKSYSNYLDLLRAQAIAPSMLKRTTASLRQFSRFIALTYAVNNPLLPQTNNYIKHFTNYLNSLHLSPLTIKSYKSDLSRYLGWAGRTFPGTQLAQLLTDQNLKLYLNHLTDSLSALPSTLERKLKSFTRFKVWYQDHYSLHEEADNAKPHPQQEWSLNPSTLNLTSPDQSTEIVKKINSRNILVGLWSPTLRSALTLGIILLFTATLAIFGYRQFSRDVQLTQAYPSTPVTPNRQLSFQGRLENAGGTPITTATDFVFKLFTASSGGTELYSSGTCSIDPDSDGVFSTQIGSTCGSGITSSVFTENANVWLEVKVGTELLDPRQQIATVAYALNAETIQGFPISSTVSAIRNTVVPMNQWGEILIGEQSPRMRGISGTFAISAPALSITTNTGTNGNISLAPDGTGQINATGNTTSTNFFNVSNAQLTSGSLITGTVGNNNSGFKLIDLLSGSSPTSKFSVTDAGNLTLAGDLTITGGNITSATTFDSTLTVTGTTTTNGISNIGDGGDSVTLNGSSVAIQTTGAGSDLTLDAVDQIILSDFTTCTALETIANVLTCGSDAGGGGTWDTIGNPGGDLTLTMLAYNSTFNWDPGANLAETNFSLTTQGEDTIGSDEEQVLLALSQTSNGVDVTEAADALLTLTNLDADDPVENALRFDAGAAGTDFTYGLNFDAANIGTAELVLENSEQIHNQVDGTLTLEDGSGADYASFTSSLTALSGALTALSANLTPSSDTSALTLTGTNVSSANLAYFNSKNTSGSILNEAYGAATTIAGSLTGFNLDLNTNVSPAGQSITGLKIQQSLTQYGGTNYGAYIDGTYGNSLALYDGTSNNTLLMADAGVFTLKPTALDNVQTCAGHANCVAADSTGTFTTNTTEAKTNAGTPFELLAANAPGNTSLYLGLDHPFATLNVDVVTANVGMSTMLVEYWNGSSWANTSATDNTSLFTVDGTITWTMPTTWATKTVNSVTKYWIRVRNSVGTISTAPTAYFISPTTNSRVGLYAQSGDSAPAISVLDNGNVGIGVAIPTSKLDIAGASSTISNSSGDITIDSFDGQVILATDDDFLPTLGAGSADLGSVALPWDNLYATNLNLSGSASDLTLIDNTAGALQILEGANVYLDITTTNDSESFTLNLPAGGATSHTANLFNANIAQTINLGTGTAVDTINLGTGGTNPDDINIGGLATSHTDVTGDLNLAGGTTYFVDESGNAKFLDLQAVDTGNPGFTVGNGSIGFILLGGSTLSDNAGDLTIDSDSLQTVISDDLAISGGNITTATTFDSTVTITGTTTANGTFDANGIVTLGDGGDSVEISGSSLVFDIALTDEVTLTASDLSPSADAGSSLGTTSLGWNNLYLDSGAIIGFENTDVTLTHATDSLSFAGGDYNFTTIDGATINFAGDGTANADLVDLAAGTVSTTGVSALNLSLTATNQTNFTNYLLEGSLTAQGTIATDLAYGIYLDLAAQAGGNETALKIQDTAEWEVDIDFQSEETLSNATDDTLVFTGVGGTNNTSLTLDLDGASTTVPTLVGGASNVIAINDSLHIGVDGSITENIAAAGFTSGGDDLYVEDMLGVDGSAYFDGAVDMASTLTVASTLDANGVVTLGDSGDTIALDSSDWDINTTGDMTGIGTITNNGAISTTIDDAVNGSVTDILTLTHTTSGTPEGYSTALLNMNGTDASTTITDESEKTWTASGNAQIDTAQSKFGGASALFDGASDYITGEDSVDYNWADNTDFTIDFWARPNAAGAQEYFYDGRGAGGTAISPLIYKSSGNVVIYNVNGATRITGTTALSTATWYHIAITRSGDNTKLFINGTQEGSTYTDNNAYVNAAPGPVLGINTGDFSTSDFNGWLDSVRVVKGLALWTSNFTAPTTETAYADGLGAGILFRAEDSAGTSENVGRIYAALADVTSASEDSNMVFETRAGGGALTKAMRIDGTGNVYSTGTMTQSDSPDLAENVIVTDPSIEAGDLVMIDPGYQVASDSGIYNRFAAKKAQGAYSQQVLGVISTDPGILLNAPEDAIETGARSGDNERPLTLTGRVPVKVSTINGNIQAGDYITSSNIPGIGMKATEAGTMIGKALEPLACPEVCEAKILTLVTLSYAEPQLTFLEGLSKQFNRLIAQFASIGSLRVATISPLAPGESITLTAPVVINQLASDTPALTVSGEILASTISARLAHLTEIQAETITARNIVADTISANHIEGLDAKIASLSGDLSDSQLTSITERIKARLAQLTGNLPTAEDIPAPQEATASQIPNGGEVGPSLASADLDFVTINHYLAVIGQATITDLDITSHLYTASIDSKTGILALANNTLIIDETGTVLVNGDLAVTGKITATELNLERLNVFDEGGSLVATIDASGSANLASLTTSVITIASPAISSASAGLAELLGTAQSNATAGQNILLSPNTELTIESPFVTPNSLVYLTPTGNTDNKVVFVKSKQACDENHPELVEGSLCTPSFTVAIDAPASSDISFNWWIIQLEPDE